MWVVVWVGGLWVDCGWIVGGCVSGWLYGWVKRWWVSEGGQVVGGEMVFGI